MELAVLFAAVDKPDIYVTLENMANGFAYFTYFLRLFFVGASLIWLILGFVNLWSVSTAQNGVPNKFFPSKSQPTAAGAWLQVFVAGLAFIMAYKMIPAALISQLITGEVIGVEIYSVGSYDPTAVGAVEIRSLIRDLLSTVMQFIGWLAYYRGFSVWFNISQGTSDEKPGRIAGYFFFGTLCMAFEWVNSLIANTLGFDLFGLFL